MPLMEAVLQQDFLGEPCLNRWNYIASGTPASVSFSFALTSALGAIESVGVYPVGELMDLIAIIQDAQCTFENLTVRDVYSQTDFYESPFTVPFAGKVVGNGLSPSIAYGFRTNRTRLDIRRGMKRFAGGNVTVYDGNNVFNAVFITQLQDIAAKMSETLEYDDEGNTLTFAPVVVKREKYQVPGSDPARFAYRYNTNEAQQLQDVMSSIIWEPFTNTRTQGSRQVGRGA